MILAFKTVWKNWQESDRVGYRGDRLTLRSCCRHYQRYYGHIGGTNRGIRSRRRYCQRKYGHVGDTVRGITVMLTALTEELQSCWRHCQTCYGHVDSKAKDITVMSAALPDMLRSCRLHYQTCYGHVVAQKETLQSYRRHSRTCYGHVGGSAMQNFCHNIIWEFNFYSQIDFITQNDFWIDMKINA